MNQTFQLTGMLDINRIDTLHSALEALLAEEGMVTLDAEAVERIDTSALQLLVAFKRELDKKGFDLQWSKTSDAVINTARILGLIDTLNLGAQH